MQLPEIQLHYGSAQPLRLPFDGDRFRSFHGGPSALADRRAAVRDALSQSEDFPPLSALCVPGDRAVVVLDRTLPCPEAVLTEVVSTCCASGVEPQDLTILQPANWRGRTPTDPRLHLPQEFRSRVRWKIHDPTRADSTGYLANSVAGERIYLARELLDADLVIPLFAAGFDSVLGYRSPGNLLFPGLSTVEAFTRSHGEGHCELRPEDERPLRQLGEDVCWLLGIQYAIGVSPGCGADSMSAIWAGRLETVQRDARQFVSRAWRVQLERRAETVVAAVSKTSGCVDWDDLGAALAAAQHLVVRGGRILILSSLEAAPGPGADIVRSSRSPKAALQRLRKESPPDLVSSVQWASAAEFAQVYLLSRLDAALVEDLLVTPVESPKEAERWIAAAEDVVLIDGGEHVWGEIVSE